MKCALLVSALLGAANAEWTEELSAELRMLTANASNSTANATANATAAPTATAAPNATANATAAPTATAAPNATANATAAPTTLAPTTLAPTTLAPTTVAATTVAASGNATTVAATTASPTVTPTPVVMEADLDVTFPEAAKDALLLDTTKLTAVKKAVGSTNFKTYCDSAVLAQVFETTNACKEAFTSTAARQFELAMSVVAFARDSAAVTSGDLDLSNVRRLAAHGNKITNKFTLTVNAATAAFASTAVTKMGAVGANIATKLLNTTEQAARFNSIQTIAEATSAGAFTSLNVTQATLTSTVSAAPITGGVLATAAVSSAATVAVSAAASLVMGALFLF